MEFYPLLNTLLDASLSDTRLMLGDFENYFASTIFKINFYTADPYSKF